MLSLTQLLSESSSYIKLGATLFLAGGALIAVNIITHQAINYYSEKRKDYLKVQRQSKPLLKSTSELISRIVELLITHNDELLKEISKSRSKDIAEREVTVAEMNRLESTAFRLVKFLALSQHFERQMFEVTGQPVLDRIEYFLQHKIAVGLRGNLYNYKFLGTEVQEEMGTSFLDEAGGEASELSIGTFLEALNNKEFDPDMFGRALRVFALDPPTRTLSDGIDHDSDSWRHTLGLAHLAIYLIDFYQELAVDPQWEEHRVFFVKLVDQWNSTANKHRYLYEHGDLSTGNYIDTYPAQRTSNQSSRGIARFIPFIVRRVISREWMHFILNRRGARFGRRHHPKQVHKWGVRIKVGGSNYDVRWDGDLEQAYEEVRSYSKKRLLHM